MNDIIFDLNHCVFLYYNLFNGILICVCMFALPYLIYAGLKKFEIWKTGKSDKPTHLRRTKIDPLNRGKSMML